MLRLSDASGFMIFKVEGNKKRRKGFLRYEVATKKSGGHLNPSRPPLSKMGGEKKSIPPLFC